MDLLEFIPDSENGRLWNAYDHSSETGYQILSDPSPIIDGNGMIHVFADGTRNDEENSDLLEFIPDNVNGRLWNVYVSGYQVTFDQHALLDSNGLIHVFADGAANISGNSGLLELIPDNRNGRLWSAYDHSNDTGYQVCGVPSVVLDTNGLMHVYVPSAVNTLQIADTIYEVANLLEFIPDNRNGQLWSAYDHTNETGYFIFGNPSAIRDTQDLIHIYVMGNSEPAGDSHLLEFIPDNQNGRLWSVYDRTEDTGYQISGDPFALLDANGLIRVYVQGISDNLLEFVPDNQNGLLWSVYDLTNGAGFAIVADPSAVLDANGLIHIYVGGPLADLVERDVPASEAEHFDLLEFIPDNQNGRLWNAYNHSDETGYRIAGRPAPVVSSNGLIHVFVLGGVR